MSPWINRLFRRLRQPCRRGFSGGASTKPSRRPQLEVLEGRDVPSTFGPWESLAGGTAKQIVALNPTTNGPLQVIGIASNGSVFSQQKSGATWSAPQNLGGVALQLAAVPNFAGHADVFVVGADHAVYWNSQVGGNWTGWQNLGGYATQVAAQQAFNLPLNVPEEELFAIGTGNAVFHRALPSNGSGWGNWEDLGGSALKIAAPQAGAIFIVAPEVLAIGVNHDVWDRMESVVGWGAWQGLGGYATDLGVGLSGADEDLYVIGSDSAVWRRVNMEVGTGWGAWKSLGGVASQIAVSGGEKNIDVFALGAGGSVWHGNEVTGVTSWSGWEGLGGAASQLTCSTNGADQIDLFALGAFDNAVYHRSGK
jgi:hypothetical protein